MTLETRDWRLETGKSGFHGFTLVETLVAIAIMTISIAGPLFTASRAIISAESANSQMTASYLAQEGIEYVRMVRDNEYLAVYNQPNSSSLAWTNFSTLISPCRSSTCTLDPIGRGVLTPCSGPSCTALWLADTNIYTQTQTGVPTIYTRTIQTTTVTPNDEKVVSSVSWTFHGIPYVVTVTDHLTPWQ